MRTNFFLFSLFSFVVSDNFQIRARFGGGWRRGCFFILLSQSSEYAEGGGGGGGDGRTGELWQVDDTEKCGRAVPGLGAYVAVSFCDRH